MIEVFPYQPTWAALIERNLVARDFDQGGVRNWTITFLLPVMGLAALLGLSVFFAIA